MNPIASIPADLIILEREETNTTYKIADNKIQGKVDGLEALQQAIYKVLNTEKYEYPVYSFSYGIELESLIGKEIAYVKVELKRRIRECLLQDSRIKSVDNFIFDVSGDNLSCVFDVTSIYGETTISKEVNV